MPVVDSKDDFHLLDTRGLYCPEPVMLLHNLIRNISPGEKIKILATDPSTRRDIPKFCQFLGHDLLQSGEEICMEAETESIYMFVINKALPTKEP
jgi:tRNA 2-thiouridine synthesizing protein A